MASLALEITDSTSRTGKVFSSSPISLRMSLMTRLLSSVS